MQSDFITQRLRLTALTATYREFIQELVNTPGWLRFIGDRKIHTPEDADAYINRINNNANIKYWVVMLPGEEKPIGVITFIKRDYLDHHDIGFAFLPVYAKLGYAFEATSAILAYLANERSVERMLATTVPDNINSINLLTRLGFTPDQEITIEGEKLLVYGSNLQKQE